MWPSLTEEIPTLCIDDYYDYHRDFLDRCDSLNEIRDFFKNSCTRFLCYGGSPKLVVSQQASILYHYLRSHLGIQGELITISEKTKGSTINQLIQSPTTLEKIIDFSGVHKKLQIIGWAGTSELWELAHFLEDRYALSIFLPETPLKTDLWIQQYLDTKHGFRSVTSTIFSLEEKVLPEGFVCLSEREMIRAVRWFLSRNKDCIIKPNKGCLGKGIIVFQANQSYREEEIRNAFIGQKNLFLDEPIIVEEKIVSGKPISPSIEYYIPPINQGNPKFTYLVNQSLHQDFCFVGNVISRAYKDELWYASLLEKGDRLARHVQKLGYVGYMDIDCIVDESQDVYFVEVNPRRTGGTHYHEIAVQLFGEDYLQEIALISNSHIQSSRIRSFEELYSKTIDLLYTPLKKEHGIIITEANLLSSYGTISVASIGKNENEAANHLLKFQERIR